MRRERAGRGDFAGGALREGSGDNGNGPGAVGDDDAERHIGCAGASAGTVSACAANSVAVPVSAADGGGGAESGERLSAAESGPPQHSGGGLGDAVRTAVSAERGARERGVSVDAVSAVPGGSSAGGVGPRYGGRMADVRGAGAGAVRAALLVVHQRQASMHNNGYGWLGGAWDAD